MTLTRKTKNQLSVAAIFASGWFAFLLLANIVGINIDFSSNNLMLIWICYFILMTVVASIFLMQPKWYVQKFHVYLLFTVIGVGVIGVIKLYLYYGNIIPNIILACAFAIIGFLFAGVFADKWQSKI